MSCRFLNALDIFQLSSYLTFKQNLALLFSPFGNTSFLCFHDNLLSWAFLLAQPSHGLCRFVLYLAMTFSQYLRFSPKHSFLLSLFYRLPLTPSLFSSLTMVSFGPSHIHMPMILNVYLLTNPTFYPLDPYV